MTEENVDTGLGGAGNTDFTPDELAAVGYAPDEPTLPGTEAPAEGSVRFLASLPDLQSAISMGDDARIKLDIPASHKGAIYELDRRGRARLLRVTIEFL